MPTSNLFWKYLWFCHRLPERSFVLHGKQFPVCARCTGIWVGYVAALPLLLWNLLPWYLALGLALPAIIDGTTQLLHWRTSNNLLRFSTGILLGIAELVLFGTIAQWWIQFGYTTGQQWFN